MLLEHAPRNPRWYEAAANPATSVTIPPPTPTTSPRVRPASGNPHTALARWQVLELFTDANLKSMERQRVKPRCQSTAGDQCHSLGRRQQRAQHLVELVDNPMTDDYVVGAIISAPASDADTLHRSAHLSGNCFRLPQHPHELGNRVTTKFALGFVGEHKRRHGLRNDALAGTAVTSVRSLNDTDILLLRCQPSQGWERSTSQGVSSQHGPPELHPK